MLKYFSTTWQRERNNCNTEGARSRGGCERKFNEGQWGDKKKGYNLPGNGMSGKASFIRLAKFDQNLEKNGWRQVEVEKETEIHQERQSMVSNKQTNKKTCENVKRMVKRTSIKEFTGSGN